MIRTTEALLLLMLIIPLGLLPATKVIASSIPRLGVKGEEWAKYILQDTMVSDNERWETLRFCNTTETSFTINLTLHMVGLETTQTYDVDLATSEDTAMTLFSTRAYLIAADLNVNDFVCLGIFGNRSITGKAVVNYAGADREVVFSNFTDGASQYTLYWDKKTGILTEGTMMSGALYVMVLISETNAWTPAINWLPLVAILLTGATVSLVVWKSRRDERRKNKPALGARIKIRQNFNRSSPN